MRVAIVGSREGIPEGVVEKFVAKLAAKYPDTVVISGGARGVDSRAEQAARDNGLRTIIYPADWKAHGRSAGFRRNVTIVENADRIVAFTTGSAGTQHTIDLARRAGKPVDIFGREAR